MTTQLRTEDEAALTPQAGARGVSPPLETPAGTLAIGMWIGLVAGFAEVAVQLAAVPVVDRVVYFDPNTTWMVPLLYLSLYSLLALVLAVLGRRWRRLCATRIAVAVPTFLAVLTGLLMFPRVHVAAMALLAAGVAVQAGRLIELRLAAGFGLLVRRTLGPLAALLLLLSGGVPGWRYLAERRALAALPPAVDGAPNVLLVIWDTARAASMSLHGYARRTTPYLDHFARRGARFDRAVATAPWTLPSHGSLFTGRYPHEMSTDWESALDRAHPTLAEVLRDRGYRTAGFVANRTYTVHEFGFDRGFATYQDYALSAGQVLDNSTLMQEVTRLYNTLFDTYHRPGRKPATAINEELLDWLDGSPAGRPFFVFLNYFDAHEPYVAELPGQTFSPGEPITRRMDTGERHSPAELQALQDTYDATLVYLDHHFGDLLAELDRRGALRNTIVIVTSDHGEEFGEHGYVSHGNGLYFPSLHVPLVIVYPPRVPAGAAVGEPVTLRDVPATVADLLGFHAQAPFPGRSLARFWTGAPDSVGPTDVSGARNPPASPLLSELRFVRNQPEWYPVSKGDMASLVEGRHHLIRNGDGTVELYDVVADPLELRDLAASEPGRTIAARLRAALDSLLPKPRSGDPQRR